MPDWSELPLLSGSVQQRADSAGNILGSSALDAASTNIDPRISDFILYGVFNGAFARGPDDPDEAISDINPLPDWTGPIQVSGGAITCSWVADSSSPSGYNLRFSIAAGAAGDEAYVEQIVPVGGSRARVLGNSLRASYVDVSSPGGTPTIYVKLQYLTATGAETGNATTSGGIGTGLLIAYAHAQEDDSPPTDAVSLRIRMGVARGTVPAANEAVVDFADVRGDRAFATVLIGEQQQGNLYSPGLLRQTSGYVTLSPNGDGNGSYLMLGFSSLGAAGDAELAASGNLYLQPLSTGHVLVVEKAAPGTPPSDTYSIYAKTDGILYGKNDSGIEVPIGSGFGIPVVSATTISANQNNYAPTGWPTSSTLAFTTSGAARTITGWDATGCIEGQVWTCSVSSSTASYSLTLVPTSASSSAGNRMGSAGDVNLVVRVGGGWIMQYMPSVSANNPFRIIATNA